MATLVELVRRGLAWCVKHKIISAIAVIAIVVIVPTHHSLAAGWQAFATNPLDGTAVLLAGIIQLITGVIGDIILRLIELIVIPVLGYKGFYTSHITNLGWSLVRDVVNMFVVLVLLVVAVMTIVGYSAANWTQTLPRLFVAIVFVNFSKLICGVLIDISQVIMFTFVNAIISIAAGNFAAMLGLSAFGKFGADFITRVNEQGTGYEAYMFLGAAYVQFVVMLAILSVMFLLAVAFIWRIVVLWILIIMSPLAFFAWGIKDVFHSAGSSFSSWMGKFSSALMFGPILTFFLWLALAASAGSTLAQTEDFPLPQKTNDLNLPLEMFSLDNFLGMFLALAILIAGMQQASQSAQAMGGFASKMLDEKMGTGAASWLAKSPFKAATGFKKERAWASDKVQKGAAWTGQFAPTMTKKAGVGVAKAGTWVSGLGQQFRSGVDEITREQMGKAKFKSTKAVIKAIGSAVGGVGGFAAETAGGTISDLGAAGATGSKEAVKAKQKRGLEGFEHQTDEMDMATRLRATGKGERSADPSTSEQDLAFRRKMLTDESARGKHRTKMEEYFEKQVEAENKKQTDPAQRKDVKIEAKKRAEANYQETMKNILKESETETGKVEYGLSAEEKDRLDDMKTANPMFIEPKGVKKPGDAGFDNTDGSADRTKYDDAKQKAIKEHYQKMSDKGRLDIRTIHKGSFADENSKKALKTFTVETRDGKRTSVWSQLESGAGTIDQRKAIAGLITPEEVLDNVEGKKNITTLVNAGAVTDKDPDGQTKRRDNVIQAIRSATRDTVDSASHGAAAAAILEDGEMDVEDVFGPNVNSLALDRLSVDDNLKAQTNAMLTSDISSARHFDTIVPEGTGQSVATEIIANRTTQGSVKRLENTRSSGGIGSQEAMQALKVIHRSIKAELDREHSVPDAQRNEKRIKQLEDIEKEISVGDRYVPNRRGGAGGGTP